MTKKDVICLAIVGVLLIPTMTLIKSTKVSFITAIILGITMTVIAHKWNSKDNNKNKK